MLFYIIFIHYFSIVLASWNVFDTYLEGYRSNEEYETHRYRRDNEHEYDTYVKSESISICNQLRRTSTNPFVVVILYKTSGRFLGMGSIIDKQTILTASRVVVSSVHRPSKILAMAGRRSAWWGDGAQVYPASEIHLSGSGLAMMRLAGRFSFNKNVMPIQLGMLLTDAMAFTMEYDKHWVVFGIPRSSWNVPGEVIPKPNIYIVKIETALEKKEDMDMCKMTFPDLNFNDTTMGCTSANGSFCWGCLGSPVVAVDQKKQIVQIGVIIRATMTETDLFHTLVKTGYYNQWIKSNSLLGFSTPI